MFVFWRKSEEVEEVKGFIRHGTSRLAKFLRSPQGQGSSGFRNPGADEEWEGEKPGEFLKFTDKYEDFMMISYISLIKPGPSTIFQKVIV